MNNIELDDEEIMLLCDSLNQTYHSARERLKTELGTIDKRNAELTAAKALSLLKKFGTID